MRRYSLLIVATAALQSIPAEADLASDGTRLRGESSLPSSFEFDDATISIELDRGVMRSGDRAAMTIVASSPREHDVALVVEVFEDASPGRPGREQRPKMWDVRVLRKEVTVHATAGGGPPITVPFTAKNRFAPVGVPGWFEVVVEGRRATKADQHAQCGVLVWTGNSFELAIEPPTSIPADGPFDITVRIKNTTRTRFLHLHTELGASIYSLDSYERLIELRDTDDFTSELVSGEWDDDVVPAGATRSLVFRITPKRAELKRFTIVATAIPIGAGALATLTIDRP